MDKKLQNAFNDQIKHEASSSYIYLAMAAWCETKNLPGIAHWMKVQAKEETGHAMKIYDFVIDRGGTVVLQAIPAPQAEYTSALDVFEKTLAHEKKITALIEALAKAAEKADDRAAGIFLQWFVTEQVEEEKNATHIVETLKSIGASAGALIMLDHQLGKRA